MGFMMALANPASKQLSFWFAVIGLTTMAIISTYGIEKPIARRLRRRATGAGPAGPVATRSDAVSLPSVD
jgi:hypothetical protein